MNLIEKTKNENGTAFRYRSGCMPLECCEHILKARNCMCESMKLYLWLCDGNYKETVTDLTKYSRWANYYKLERRLKSLNSGDMLERWKFDITCRLEGKEYIFSANSETNEILITTNGEAADEAGEIAEMFEEMRIS